MKCRTAFWRRHCRGDSAAALEKASAEASSASVLCDVEAPVLLAAAHSRGKSGPDQTERATQGELRHPGILAEWWAWTSV